MKLAAIICEYNPFHNGHRYQIEKIKEELHPDGILAVMSGDFVQRGMPAFCDKYARTSFALENGIDMIFELPVRYATSSAEFFASSAVFLLNSLNCIDYLVFGCESDDLKTLDRYADLFLEEPEEYRILLQKHLKNGASFPSARNLAADEYLKTSDDSLLSKPNNILGIEYLKALKKCHSQITPFIIKRSDSGYHNTAITSPVTSASSIRTTVTTSGVDSLVTTSVPSGVSSYLKGQFQKTYPIDLPDASDFLFYQLIMDAHPESYADFHPELWDRILKNIRTADNIDALIDATKTKNFTYSRISRYLIHLLLQIPAYSDIFVPYGKLLGFQKNSSHLLKYCKNHTSIPLIQKIGQYNHLLEDDARSLFEEDLRASHLYHRMVQRKYGTLLPEETKRPLLIV